MPLRCFTHLVCPYTAPEKQSHGDVDLLAVLAPSFPQHTLSSILESAGLYDPRDHSYLHDLDGLTYQVDLTLVSETSLQLELFVRSYGDVGAIVGAYARCLGYKLSGSGGLQVRLQSTLSGGCILYDLTRDVREICDEYLNLDYERWQQGFETEAELFEWMKVTARYLRSEKKKTKRERPMFTRFQAWCLMQPDCREQPDLWKRLEEVGRAEEVRRWYEKEVKKEADARALRIVFNGGSVSEYVKQTYGVDLKGTDLGEFMKKVRLKLPKESVPTQNELFKEIDAVWASGELNAAM